MKREIFEFNTEEREILLKGLRSFCFFDLKNNQENINIIDKLEKELGFER